MTYEGQDLHDRVVEIAADYLGPASKRFIDRQIVNHLHKQPEELTNKDLEELINWIEVVTALITEDKKLIKEFAGRLHTLNDKQRTA